MNAVLVTISSVTLEVFKALKTALNFSAAKLLDT